MHIVTQPCRGRRPGRQMPGRWQLRAGEVRREATGQSVPEKCCKRSPRHNCTQRDAATGCGETAVDRLSSATVIVNGWLMCSKGISYSAGRRGVTRHKGISSHRKSYFLWERLTFTRCLKGIGRPWSTFIQINNIGNSFFGFKCKDQFSTNNICYWGRASTFNSIFYKWTWRSMHFTNTMRENP